MNSSSRYNGRYSRVRRIFLAYALAAGLLCSCSFFPEAIFALPSTCRLPWWFALPPGLARKDVTVTMSYFSTPFGNTVKFAMVGFGERTIAKVSGPLGPMLHLRGVEYPSYYVVTISGITEIVEHRKMEPIFYLTDDPSVWRSLTSKK